MDVDLEEDIILGTGISIGMINHWIHKRTCGHSILETTSSTQPNTPKHFPLMQAVSTTAPAKLVPFYNSWSADLTIVTSMSANST